MEEEVQKIVMPFLACVVISLTLIAIFLIVSIVKIMREK